MREKLRAEILDLIAEVTETEATREDVAASFMEGATEGAAVDSLMALEIVAALEKKYKIQINEDDLPKLATLDDTVELVERLIKEKEAKGEKKKTGKKKSQSTTQSKKSGIKKLKTNST